MKWGTSEPKREGWYLCTVKIIGGVIIAPLFRMEYPQNNYSWEELHDGEVVIASIKFPKPWEGEKK